MKCNHPEFISDVFVLLETVNANIKLVSPNESDVIIKCSELFEASRLLKGRLVHSMTLRPYDKSKTLIKTYKVMPRSQNSHAYVNAGFNFTFSDEKSLTVESCSIVFGGLSSKFVHATLTESFLVNKRLCDQNVVADALETLSNELVIDADPVIRKSLKLTLYCTIIHLIYKFDY
jgi:xanthine dehydrogenase/oxidase